MEASIIQMVTKLLISFRKNKFASWCFAFFIGFSFRYIYGIIKNVLWNRSLDFFTLNPSTSKLQILAWTVALNFVVDFTSSLVAAIICGSIMIYVLEDKAFFFTIPAIALFLALSARLWRFWQAPDLGMQISTLMGPILACLVFAGATWLILKIKNTTKLKKSLN